MFLSSEELYLVDYNSYKFLSYKFAILKLSKKFWKELLVPSFLKIFQFASKF
jgi:hypothetical protein